MSKKKIKKAQAKKKPVSKKRVAVKKASKATKHEIVVRVDTSLVVPTTTDLAEPMREGTKLTIPKTWISGPQLIRLTEKTPRAQIYQRPGKGGKTFDYVTVSYIQRLLDYVFGWNWDFEIVEHGKEDDHVWVMGKLTVHSSDGQHKIVKTQFGRSEVKKLKSGGNVDYGNDLKSASSDALKKCASMLGIARDIYGKTDYKEESGKDPVDLPVIDQTPEAAIASAKARFSAPQPGQVIGPGGEPTYTCVIEGDPISDQIANYSLKVFGKRLCREHQAEAKPLKK